MSTLIKIIVGIFIIIFLYGFIRPLAVSTYCRSHVGAGNGSINVTFEQALNPESANAAQNQAVQDCIDQTLPKFSIQPIEDLFNKLASPNSIPGINGH